MTILVLILGVIGHVVLWVSVVNRVHSLGIRRRWVDAITLFSGLLLVALPLLVAAALWMQSKSQSIPGLTFVAWGYVCGCALVCVVASVQRWRWSQHPERHKALLTNHTVQINLAENASKPLAAAGLPRLLSRLPGNEVLTICVQEKHLAMPRLVREHQGLRIAHVTDLHMSGRITREYFERVVDEVNRCDADIVALTGDLVERVSCLDWVPSTFGRLRARAGVYFVLGNHDRHVGKLRLTAALTDAGLIYLGGTSREVVVRDTPVILAGNELPWFGPAADLSAAPDHDDRGLPLRILLSHTPDQFAWAQAHEIDLMLAGHNHGGQICFPMLGPIVAPSRFGVRYAAGVYRAGNTVLHVSRGTSSLTPVRWNCRPEIAVLNLRAADDLA